MASSPLGAAEAPTAPSDAVDSRAAAPVEKEASESSKLKTFLSLLRKFVGVSDLAAVRFSLPAQLLEPTPNLEYWNYLDRPETFISIGDSDDPVGRMLGALRFWFTKDLKYVKGKPVKPYNSMLGEFFRCNWEVEDTTVPLRHPNSAPQSSAASVASTKSTIATGASASSHKVRVSFLTEQTSHHPPVSAFYIDCPEKGIVAKGYDHLSAKFTGTSIRVTAGAHNLGIFIYLQKWDEEYQMTHPAAHLGGILRGSLSVSVADSCFITCPKTRLKVILEYLEEGWLGRTQNRVIGAIYSCDTDSDKLTKVKDVPEADIIARIDGCWMDKIFYSLGSTPFARSTEKILLIDLNPLFPVPKIAPPMEEQLPNESRKFWDGVTKAILNKQFGLATQLKQELEEKQRKRATERKETDEEWHPRFFTGAVTPVGKPELTPDGQKALEGLHNADFKIAPSKVYAAF